LAVGACAINKGYDDTADARTAYKTADYLVPPTNTKRSHKQSTYRDEKSKDNAQSLIVQITLNNISFHFWAVLSLAFRYG
jgi:hypothetical protein